MTVIQHVTSTAAPFYAWYAQYGYPMPSQIQLARAEVNTKSPSTPPTMEYRDITGIWHNLEPVIRIPGTNRFRYDAPALADSAAAPIWTDMVRFSTGCACLQAPDVMKIIENTCPQGETVPVLASLVSGTFMLQLREVVHIPEPQHVVVRNGTTDYEISVGSTLNIAGQNVSCLSIGRGFACLSIGSSGTTAPGGDGTGTMPPGEGTGPTIIECAFPTFTPNLWGYFGDLFAWVGCILRNIILILQWVADWFLHFPDHLDAWISRLFGVDPSLPFFDEVLKKIDVWISGKFGVDPALPFWEELVKKALAWIAGSLDASSEERMRIRKWK